jgi:hypothetical protein
MGGGSHEGGGLWGKYLQLLETQPFLTRVLTCGVLNGLGDIFCQLFVEKEGYSAKRTLTFAGLGVVFVGPCLFYWYGLLGKLVPGTDIMSILASLALDQLVYAPVFIAGFMSILTAIEGKPEAIQAKLQQDLFPAIKVNWGLWVPAQYINFKFVPPNLRTLAVNITALVWNVYMSWSSHKTVAPAPVAATPTPTPTKSKKGAK